MRLHRLFPAGTDLLRCTIGGRRRHTKGASFPPVLKLSWFSCQTFGVAARHASNGRRCQLLTNSSCRISWALQSEPTTPNRHTVFYALHSYHTLYTVARMIYYDTMFTVRCCCHLAAISLVIRSTASLSCHHWRRRTAAHPSLGWTYAFHTDLLNDDDEICVLLRRCRVLSDTSPSVYRRHDACMGRRGVKHLAAWTATDGTFLRSESFLYLYVSLTCCTGSRQWICPFGHIRLDVATLITTILLSTANSSHRQMSPCRSEFLQDVVEILF